VLLVAAYLDSLGMWSLIGHSETQKVRKNGTYTKKEEWILAGDYQEEKLP
jgi:hypothetical protein